MENNKLLIGSHVSFTSPKQLLGSVEEALSYGSNTFMFYTGAPQNTKRSTIKDNFTKQAQQLMQEHNIDIEKVIIHAPYIINLGNLSNINFSVSFLKEEIYRAHKLGIKYIVLHPGAYVNYPKEASIDSIIDGLNIALNNDYDITICIETMAGKGTEIGSTLEEIKTIIEGIEYKNKIGVCLDTCHLSDSGVDLSKFDEYLDLFEQEIGISYIKCIHINDSKNDVGSHKDRHENFGLGSLGFDNLINIIYNERLKDIPKILETPYVAKIDDPKQKIYPPYKYEIEMIRNKKFDENLIEKIRGN